MEDQERLAKALADRYRIEREIGRGGMATVYLAEDLKHDRKVAVKVLKPELAAILGAERFLSEIKVTANLQHPHILPLHDSGEADSFLFYVMPYVEGESLRAKVDREKQLSVEEALGISTSVANALDYAHRQGVIHRDIKPGNILLHDGQALVADFGIALAVSAAGGNRITETGLSLGTPEYMSPEQATGDRELDARSDVYSLGAVLYEMLSGDPPHVGSTVQAVIGKLLTDRPRPVRELRDTVPIHVELALDRALARLPADRFSSGVEFAEALAGRGFSKLESGRRTETETRAVGVQKDRKDPFHWRSGVIPVAALALGFLTGWWMWATDSDPSRQVGWFSFDVEPADANYGSPIDVASAGDRVVYVGVSEEGGQQLFRRDLDEPAPIPIAGTASPLLGIPTISPDGQSVGFYSDQAYRVVSVEGGTVRPITTMGANARGADWGPDNVIVFQAESGSGLSKVSAEGGVVTPVTTPDSAAGELGHRWPHVLPDGKSVLFTIWKGQPETAGIGMASLETGEHEELLPGTAPRYLSSGHLVFATPVGALRAVGFEPKRGSLQGDPFTVLDSIVVDADGAAHYGLSDSGTLAFFSSPAQQIPVLVDRNGRKESLPIDAQDFTSPRFSPDGGRVAVGALENVWVFEAGPGTFTPLTFEGGFYPLWTDSGRTVLFSRDDGSDVNIFEVPVDRANDPAPVLLEDGQHRTQSVTQDGRFVMIRMNVGGQYDLWVLDRETENGFGPWLTTEFLERAPTFSPGGNWVAYSSNESERDEVYVRPFPGPGGQVRVSTDGGWEPAWSPSGRELYYRTGNQMVAVSVELGDRFRQLSQPRVLFEGRYKGYGWSRQYDPHPSGEGFLMLEADPEPAGITVVMNWFQGELARLGPPGGGP